MRNVCRRISFYPSYQPCGPAPRKDSMRRDEHGPCVHVVHYRHPSDLKNRHHECHLFHEREVEGSVMPCA
jgi:hypothetical protein